MMPLLKVDQINTYRGMSHILFDVSIEVGPNEVVALLGRNGAGKSTTFKSIMGFTPPKTGKITYKGEEITGKPAYVAANKGIGYVPEEKRIFREMTVRENLEIGEKGAEGREDPWTIEKIYGLFPILGKYAGKLAGRLSGGEQQMVTIARTLMGNPELLLLDEPTTGLSPLIVKSLKENIITLSRKDLSILIAEQNVKFAIVLSRRCYILDKGEIQYQGLAKELDDAEEIKNRYLAV